MPRKAVLIDHIEQGQIFWRCCPIVANSEYRAG